mmetsp:Transcript_100128/g.172868  ORF Transcript_100128/g.172868 Transcript_100128/m.172868 type:complete len:284 (-) Transcript_100128:3210-4061(-)
MWLNLRGHTFRYNSRAAIIRGAISAPASETKPSLALKVVTVSCCRPHSGTRACPKNLSPILVYSRTSRTPGSLHSMTGRVTIWFQTETSPLCAPVRYQPRDTLGSPSATYTSSCSGVQACTSALVKMLSPDTTDTSNRGGPLGTCQGLEYSVESCRTGWRVTEAPGINPSRISPSPAWSARDKGRGTSDWQRFVAALACPWATKIERVGCPISSGGDPSGSCIRAMGSVLRVSLSTGLHSPTAYGSGLTSPLPSSQAYTRSSRASQSPDVGRIKSSHQVASWD